MGSGRQTCHSERVTTRVPPVLPMSHAAALGTNSTRPSTGNQARRQGDDPGADGRAAVRQSPDRLALRAGGPAEPRRPRDSANELSAALGAAAAAQIRSVMSSTPGIDRTTSVMAGGYAFISSILAKRTNDEGEQVRMWFSS